MRTRLQATRPGDGRPTGLLAALRSAVAATVADQPGRTRIAALWRGAGATLARDVPFSALYWTALEPTRRLLLPDPEGSSAHAVLWANVAAGSAAGMAAAAVTTPLDALKTALQVGRGGGQAAVRGGSVLRELARDGHLFVGVLPRALRAAPACGIVMATYEVLKLKGGRLIESELAV